MEFKVQAESNGVYVIQCPREMEWSARGDLVDTFASARGDKDLSGVILDLNGVSYINSAGIGAVFALRKHLLDRNARMVVARPGASVERILKTVNLPQLIPMVRTLDEARNVLSRPPESPEQS